MTLPAADLTVDQIDLVSAIALQLANEARLVGNIEDVERFADLAKHYQPDASETANELIGAAWLASAQDAYDREQYGEAVARAGNTLQYASVNRPAGLLQAWAYYKLGDAAKAQSLFAELYKAEADAEAADGLRVASGSSIYTRAIANQIADRDRAGLFHATWRTQRAEDEEAKGYFLKAYRIDPERSGAVEGIHRPWAFAGAGGRFQSGTDGADELEGATLRVAIGGTVGQNRLCLLYTSPSPRDLSTSRMPSSA